MSEEQFKHWRINQGGQALLDAMNSGEISASLFAKQVWQAALSSQSAKSVPVAWQFYQDGKWHTGTENNNHKKNTVEYGLPVRDLYAAPQPTDDRVRELEKDAARYRWLRDHYHGFESYRSRVIPYVNLDSEVDKQIAKMKGEASMSDKGCE